jgi:hypothetical protein
MHDPVLSIISNNNIPAYGNAYGIGKKAQNEISGRVRRTLQNYYSGRRSNYNNYKIKMKLNLTNSQWNRIKQLNNNLNTKTRNIVKLTQTQLKLFFKKYGNVMSKLSRNILAGSNRKGFTNLNAYFLGFPSRGA